MKFNIVLGNHPPHGINTTRDHTLIIRGGIEEAGHAARLSLDEVTRHEVNVFYDYFKADNVPYFRSLREAGIKYGLITTEILQDGKINFGAAHVRIQATAEIGHHAEFIWVMHEPSLENFRNLCRTEKCHYLPLGYSRAAQELRLPPPEQRHIDFLFFGLLTPYRKKILAALEGSGFTVLHTYNTPGFIRNSIIENSKINLVLRQNKKWEQPSVGRIIYLVTNGCAAIGEKTSAGAPYENYLKVVEPADFIEACKHMLRNEPYWDQARQYQEAFGRDFPMKGIMERLIEQTFG